MTTTPLEQTPSEPGIEFTDNPNIIDGSPMGFSSWSRLDNGDALRLYFELASPDCAGVHAIVRETPDTVDVDLLRGARPEAVDHMCTRIVVPGYLHVQLGRPLGDRKVLSTA